MKLLFACVLFFLTTSCGYLDAGTWEDDPKNWERIYYTAKPDDVNVIHSWYWNSAHWSLEYMFYIETDSNKQILSSFLSSGGLIQDEDTTDIHRFIRQQEKPVWFVPKPLDQYDIWTGAEFWDNFKLFVDKETKHLYWYDCQL